MGADEKTIQRAVEEAEEEALEKAAAEKAAAEAAGPGKPTLASANGGTAELESPRPPPPEQAGNSREAARLAEEAAREEAAAEAAALRYQDVCDGRVYCTLVGELCREPKDWPRLSDCSLDSLGRRPLGLKVESQMHLAPNAVATS